MSNFNNASLIVTPNSVKAGKLYSIKPTSGAGDLDVVRATSATRVNEQGLVEIPRTNLLLRSEEFDNASWGKSGTSIAANSTTSPSGIIDADTLTADGTSGDHRTTQLISFTSGLSYTFSVYIKKNTNDFFQIALGTATSFSTLPFANFNVNNGTLGSTGGGATSTITSVGNGWYRCTLTATATGTGSDFVYLLITTSSTSVRRETNTLSTSVFLWGAQLEVGNVATEYIPTTSVIRTRFAGITQDGGSASNIPRLDYTNGSCPSILVEPQRTNLVLRSNELNTSPWAILLNEVSIDQNFDISPDNTQNANRINFLAGYTRFTQVFTVTQNTTYTISFYIKNINTNQISINIGSTSLPIINYFSQISVNEWRRVSFTFTTNSGVTSIGPQITRDATIGSSVLIYGVQLEAGSNATSYIPTTTTAVTRNADLISKSGISNLIGQSKGSLVYYFIKNSNSSIPTISLSNNGTNPRFFHFESGTNYTFFLQGALTILVSYLYPLSNFITGLNKIGITYGAGSFKIYINGSLITSVPYTEQDLSFSKLNIGSSINNTVGSTSNNNLVLINKEILSESEMIQLTTL